MQPFGLLGCSYDRKVETVLFSKIYGRINYNEKRIAFLGGSAPAGSIIHRLFPFFK